MSLPSASTDQIARRNIQKNRSKPMYFFTGFVIISFVIAFIIGGIILGKEKTKKQDAATEIKQQIKINSSSIPDSPDSWKAYKLSETGLELKLPEKLTKLGQWKSEERPGEKGAVFCFNVYDKTSYLIKQIYAGGTGTCGGNGKDVLIIGGSSKDFEAGRDGMFTDLQGFTKEGNVFYANFVNEQRIELRNVKFKEFGNENGVKIIKVLGENSNDARTPGTPGEGYLGAIINTKNSKYPGLSIQMKLDSDISEYEFDQILKSLNFTN